MEPAQLRTLARFILEEMQSQSSADLAPKWESGTVVFKPGDADLAEHEMPIDKLMHKVVMLRDNLRVLEQQINSNEALSEGEKLKLQGYITRCYGSLTSFNFIFRNDGDKFSSKK